MKEGIKRRGYKQGRGLGGEERGKIVKLAVKGLNLVEVGKVVGVAPSTVRKVLLEDMPRETVEWYRENMGEVLTVAAIKGQMGLDEVLSDPEARKELFKRHGPGAQEKLINMVRVERGQPTEIRSVVDMRMDMNRLLGDLLKRFGAGSFEEVARIVEGEVVSE